MNHSCRDNGSICRISVIPIKVYVGDPDSIIDRQDVQAGYGS
jgi:hypothetical protein